MKTSMDEKAIKIFNHYKRLIENNLFDEYDILGFLIFMRNYLDDLQFPAIHEFCNLVAHREGRNRGTIMECIENASKSNYKTKEDGKTLENYRGIPEKQWKDEWKKLGKLFQIQLSLKSISELVLCLFSLAQFSEYSSSGYSGRINLFQGVDGGIYLTTSEDKSSSPWVCFSKYLHFDFLYYYSAGYILDAVETKRDGKKLLLLAGDKRII